MCIRDSMYIGRNCRVGENTSVIGVSVGDNCELAPGLVITPSTLVRFGDSEPRPLGPVLEPNWVLSHTVGGIFVSATRP